MDQRRAAAALLALLVCITTTAAAPTVSNQTGLDLYDSSVEGCYYNFQHYGEGDRIMTNEPCLNCTCHNRMLMCYLRVCPFTKPIGQDCTVEKRADQCCPIVTCPDVPVDLLTSTTTSPAEYGATGVGKLDKYGCSIHGKYFPEGSKVPPTPNKPCEHCYCIRNMTTCVMQECTLHVDGCTPIYHKDVCCPVRYSCDHPEDETLLLDDMTTTVRPTPGFLLTTTTLSPVTQMSQDCIHDDQIFADGALIKTEKACEHCYCMKGDIVCVVQECGTPMENEGKNCTSQPPREGQCCPDTYICEGDEITTESQPEYTTQPHMPGDLTTRRVGVEGSGYRNEPDEPAYTEVPSLETEMEGSGFEQPTEPAIQAITPGKESIEVTSEVTEELHYGTTTLRTPTLEEVETTTEPDKGLNTVPSDEEGYEPSATEKTKITDIPYTSDVDKQTHDEEKTDLPEKHTTVKEELFTSMTTSKLDEVGSTTEPAFRKEDSESTDSYETSAQDVGTTPGTKTPFMEELEKPTTLSVETIEKDAEQPTTSSSELTEKDAEHPAVPKETTTESVQEMSTSAEKQPTSMDIVTDTAQPSKTETTTPSVEKIDIPETTSLDENEIEDISTTLPPGRIPGEGDCLLNEITYKNNSEVPSYNACDTDCRCVSSIVKCNRIICSPPPAYMDNCQPTFDPPGSCCPTYVCHTGETIPPQPHSQMSGTESPVASPPIECHGDECEIKKGEESPVFSEQPSEKCDDGKCLPPTQPCDGEDCGKVPVEEPAIIPVTDLPLCDSEGNCKPIVPACEGEGCSVDTAKPTVTSGQSLCENEDECKRIKPEVPSCEGSDCSGAPMECSGPDCAIDSTKPHDVPEHPLCDNEEDCKGVKPEVSPCVGPDCTSDTSKPSVEPVHGQEPCEGDCLKQEDEVTQPCTETSCRRKETGEQESHVPTLDDHKDEIPAELPEEHSTIPETEPEQSETQSPILEDNATRAPTFDTPAEIEPVTGSEMPVEKETSKPTDEDKYPSSPEISATEGTRFGETDSSQEVATDIPEVESQTESDDSQLTTKYVLEQIDETKTSHYVPDSTETPHADDISEPHEPAAELPEEGETATKSPQLDTTELHEDNKVPVAPTDEGFIQVSTMSEDSVTELSPHQPDQDSTKTIEESEMTESPTVDMPSSKSPTAAEPTAMSESDMHESEVTDAYLEKSSTEPSIENTVPEEKETDEKIHYTPAITDTKDETTESVVATSAPGIHEIEQHDITESPERVTDTLLETTEPKQDIVPTEESVLDITKKEPTGIISDDEMKSQTTQLPYLHDHKDESLTEEPVTVKATEKTDEDLAQVTVSQMEITESSEKPLTVDKKPSIPVESPETNEIEDIAEKTESPTIKLTDSGESVTEEEVGSVTKEPITDDEVEKPESPKETPDVESITEEQEISTEEPLLDKYPGTEKMPMEPYIPVHTETTSEHTFAHTDETTKMFDESTTAHVPEKSDVDEEVHAEHTDADATKAPETVTQKLDEHDTKYPEEHTVSPQEPEAHKDMESEFTGKPTTEYPKEITKDEIVSQHDELTTVEPKYSDVPKESMPEDESATLATKIKDESPEDKQEYTDEPGRYSTEPTQQETTTSPVSIMQEGEQYQTTEPQTTDGDTLVGITSGESQVKEPQATEIPETVVTESLELGTSTPGKEISPEEPVTEAIIKETPEQPQHALEEESTSMSPQEEPKLPQEEEQGKPDMLDETSTSESLTPQELTTVKTLDGKDTEVTSHEDVTEGPIDLTTSAILVDITTKKSEAPEETMMTEQESTTKPSESPETQEPTKPDLVELEEHSHKPIDEMTTTSLIEQEDKEQVSDVTTKKPSDGEKISPTDYITETDMETEKSTSSPDKQAEPEQPVSTTDRPVERLGDEVSQDEQTTHTTTISDENIFAQTERISTSEKSPDTTDFEELMPVTVKSPESYDHTKEKEPELDTEQPLVKPEKEPAQKPSDKLDEETTDEPIQKVDEKPLEVPVEKSTEIPVQEPEVKPMKEYPEEPSEKPTERPQEMPSEEPTNKPSEEAITEKPEEGSLIEPVEQPAEKPDNVPFEETTDKHVDEPSEEITEKPEEKLPTGEMATEKPLDEPLEKEQGKPSEEPEMGPEEPAREPSEETTEHGEEQPMEIPDKEPSEGTTQQPQDKPVEETAKEPAEKTTEQPEEKPERVPAEQPSEQPEEKPMGEPAKETTEGPTEHPEEKPAEAPAKEPSEDQTEQPEEKPSDETTKQPEEKPMEKPTEEPSEIATEKPLEQPAEEPSEGPTEQPQEKPAEEPVKEPSEDRTDQPIEEPAKEPSEESTEQPEKKPAEEITEKSSEEITEAPGEIPSAVPAKEPSEEPSAQPDERLATEPPKQESESPTEQPYEKPAEEPTKDAEQASEQPGEKPTEEPAEETSEGPKEQPEETPTEKPIKEPSEEPLEKPEEKPSEKPVEEPIEKPEETPSVTPVEEPTEKPLEEPAEKPSEEAPEKPAQMPFEEPKEKPVEMPSEQPTEKPVEMPSEEATEKPVEVLSEEPTEKPVEMPSEEPTEKPVEMPSEEPAEKPVEMPSEEPTEKPVEMPSEEPTEKPVEMPSEEPTEKPVEMPSEEPTEKPVEVLSEEPTEKPVEMPSEEPTEKPVEMPSEEPTEKPVEMPSEEATEKPAGEKTEEKPVEEMPAEQTERAPASETTTEEHVTPTEKPLDEPVEKPIEEPSEQPMEVEKTPVHTPEEKPSTEAEEKVTEKPVPVTEEKPQETPVEPAPTTATPEISKPGLNDMLPTDEVPDDDHFPTSGGTSGYGSEPDYDEDQTFGPGTCRYGGKVYVSAQQIPRDDPCDFCFCFRSDIICLQQSCPPPIHGCHEEPIQGFCCPRYECPVAMATTLNVTTTTTTTTTTLPPHFLPHAYKGAAQRRGCQIKGHTYKVGEVVRASSGPCLHCTCGGDGQMKCDPKACTPEPMLRQMIAAAVSAKRRR